jgi:hypothetical protein
MKKISVDILKSATESAGINPTRARNVIATLEISLNRQAARDPQRRIVLDPTNLLQIGEAVSIGAGIPASQANHVVQAVRKKLREQDDPELRLFDESTFLLEDDELVFKLDE